jgi:hypothetical protein
VLSLEVGLVPSTGAPFLANEGTKEAKIASQDYSQEPRVRKSRLPPILQILRFPSRCWNQMTLVFSWWIINNVLNGICICKPSG